MCSRTTLADANACVLCMLSFEYGGAVWCAWPSASRRSRRVRGRGLPPSRPCTCGHHLGLTTEPTGRTEALPDTHRTAGGRHRKAAGRAAVLRGRALATLLTAPRARCKPTELQHRPRPAPPHNSHAHSRRAAQPDIYPPKNRTHTPRACCLKAEIVCAARVPHMR